MQENLPVNCEQLLGKRVMIIPSQHDQSTKFLNGLFAKVVAVHSIVDSWLKLKLEANVATIHLEWTLPADRLIVTEAAVSLDSLARFAPGSKTIQ